MESGKNAITCAGTAADSILTSGNILGIDICGECQQGIPLPQYLEAEKINGETNKELFDFLMHYCRNF